MWTGTLRAVALTLMLTMTWTRVQAAAQCDVRDLGDPINVTEVLGGTGYIYKMFQTDNATHPPGAPPHYGFVFYKDEDNNQKLISDVFVKPKDQQCMWGRYGAYDITDHGYQFISSYFTEVVWIIAHDDSHVVLYTPQFARLTIKARKALPVKFGNIADETRNRIKRKCGYAAGERSFYDRKYLPGERPSNPGNCLPLPYILP